MMKCIKGVFILLVHLSLVMMSACSGHGGVDVMSLIQERDSLRLQAEVQSQRLSNIEKAMMTMNETFDSIAFDEDMVFISCDGKEITRQGALGNLDRFEEMVKRQDKKIKDLQAELAKNPFNSDAQGLVAHLQEQINLKNYEIARLRKELENKNVDIAKLRKQVETQSLRISSQEETIAGLQVSGQKKDAALKRQDAMLNTGYVLVGTKDELRSKGVINKKGNLYGDGMLDKSKFAKVDIRHWEEVNFSAKRPKILTNMPPSAYTLSTNGDGVFCLKVTNPSDFWRFSSYLVIQTN